MIMDGKIYEGDEHDWTIEIGELINGNWMDSIKGDRKDYFGLTLKQLEDILGDKNINIVEAYYQSEEGEKELKRLKDKGYLIKEISRETKLCD